MFLCPSQACSARVSWPASSALANQSSRSQARAEAASIESAPPGLPPNMSYYRGAQPDDFRSGSPWPDANFEIVRKTAEIFPGFFVLTTVRSTKLTRGLISETPAGFRSRRGLNYDDSAPVTPHNAPFPTYKTPRVHHAARRRGGSVCGALAAARTQRRIAILPIWKEGAATFPERVRTA